MIFWSINGRYDSQNTKLHIKKIVLHVDAWDLFLHIRGSLSAQKSDGTAFLDTQLDFNMTKHSL